jgi:hypothetical protein
VLPERELETNAAAGGLWEPETLRLVMSLNMSRPEHGHNDIKRDRSRDFPSGRSSISDHEAMLVSGTFVAIEPYVIGFYYCTLLYRSLFTSGPCLRARTKRSWRAMLKLMRLCIRY